MPGIPRFQMRCINIVTASGIKYQYHNYDDLAVYMTRKKTICILNAAQSIETANHYVIIQYKHFIIQ